LLSGAMVNTFDFTGIGQTIPNPNGPSLNAYNNLVINGTGAIFPTSLNIKGDLTLNQSVDFTGKTIVMSGGITFSQYIKGTSNPVFSNLTINNNNLGDVTLQTNATITGTLTLTSGNFILENNVLTLGANAVAGNFSASTMIVATGNAELRRTYTGTGSYLFPIGEASNTVDYSPITVNVTAGTFSNAYVGVAVVDAIHPNNSSTTNNLKRYWKVNQSGITGAVATITANYVAADIIGTEGNISGGQLNGTFNQATNSWIKYTALASNSFTATGATLTAGQTSVFTGIKGGAFSVVLSGFGSFCINYNAALSAEVSGGDSPFTYLWSNGLGTAKTAIPPTSSSGTINYTITVKDANGITMSDSNNVTVLSESAGGVIASNQTICYNCSPTNLALSGQSGSVIYWQSSSDSNFTSPVNIQNTTTTLTGVSIGPLTVTTYFRAVVQSGSCSIAYSTVATIIINTTTWNGTSWNNGTPNSSNPNMNIKISGDYNTAGTSMYGVDLEVIIGNVVITSGTSLILTGSVTATAGSLTIENNASLLQTTYTGANSGNVIIIRNTAPVVKYDATFWCSPTTGTQTLYDFSPLTVSSRFNSYDSVNDLWVYENPTTKVFGKGMGYSIRCPEGTSATVPTVIPHQFVGVPNNGSFTIPLTTPPSDIGLSLIGNPYPSALNVENFIIENLYNASLNPTNTLNGTYYLWTHNTRLTGNNFTGDDYFTCNLLGATGFAKTGTGNTALPTNFIASGQGFFVENEIAGNLKFNNSMREQANNTNFYKTKNSNNASALERHRIWLNITNSAKTAGNQMLVGYVQNATNNYDSGYDSYLFDDSKPLLVYSRLGTGYLSIQGRALPFVDSDIVQIGYYTNIADTVTIAINSIDGIFLDSQGIYLEDKLLNVIYDLKSNPYVFTSEAGTFNDRFVLRYTDVSLGTKNFDGNENKVLLSIKNNQIKINSSEESIEKLTVYDLLGKQIYHKENVNSNEFVLSDFVSNHQTLLVKITLQNGKTVTHKIIY
ncbi:MAG: T9SS sorting signal type C domain-containing protein, partial [Oligoflexus sp.]|nr:T9SS sorting signal type C domain-containing protein [Pseudopedobacter sp.]